ncbi:putative anthocyanidin 3-O-glucosyltransferase [Helianthus anomalus]
MIDQTGSGRVVGLVVDVFCTGMIDMLCVDHNQDHVIELSNSEGEMVVPSFVNLVPVKAFPSLWFGVPTATWPLYAEQQLNAFEMVVELGLAIDLKMDYKIDMFNPAANIVIVTAEEIEHGITRLMEDNNVRAKVKEISKRSRVTVAEGGSSYASVNYLVQEMMSNIT